MIWLVSGPTGSGKTDLALELSKKSGRRIINADPYQFYREIPILSNQPPANAAIEGLASRSIFEPLSAGEFSRFAEKLPDFSNSLLVGTGLYIGATLYGLDSERMKGTPFQKKEKHPYRAIVLNIARAELYERLNQRVDAMIKAGAIEESERLYQAILERKNKTAALPPSAALKAIGLKTLLQFQAKEISLDRAIELWKRDTRRLAKRQWNWLRKFSPPSYQHLWIQKSEAEKILEFLQPT